MLNYDIEEVRARFEELVEKAAAGEAFEIRENGQPLVVVKAFYPVADSES